MPSLPPVDLVSWGRFAADRFRRTTDQALAGLGAHSWDLDAGRRIDDLLASFRPSPPEPVAMPATPEPLPQPSQPAYTPTPIAYTPASQPEPPPAPAPWMPLEPARAQARDWWQDATRAIEGLGTGLGGLGAELGRIPSGLQAGLSSSLEADRATRDALARAEALTSGPAPTAGTTQFPDTPAEFTLPETGTPEGERITSALAETAARQTPGGQIAGNYLGGLGRSAGRLTDPTNLLATGEALERLAPTGPRSLLAGAVQGWMPSLEDAGRVAQTAGDVANLWPTPGNQAINLGYEGARAAVIGAGLPADSPLVDLAALGLSVVGAGGVEQGLSRAMPLAGEVAERAGPLARRLATEELGGVRVAGPTERALERQARAAGRAVPEPAPLAQTVDEALDAILGSQAEVRAGQAGAGGTPPEMGPIERALSSWGAKVQAGAFDVGAPLRRAQDAIEREVGRPLTLAEDAYLQLRLFPGRADAAAQRLRDELVPAIKGLGREDESLLNAYLQAADNSDKAAAVGVRVTREGLASAAVQRAVERGQRLGAAGEAAAAQTPASMERLGQLAEQYDQLQAQVGRLEAEAAMRAPGGAAVGAIERPPWARASGGMRALTDADLAELAQRTGVNPYAPGWWQDVDAETLRLYRREAVSTRTGTTQVGRTPAEERALLTQARRDIRDVHREIAGIDRGVAQELSQQERLFTAEATGQAAREAATGARQGAVTAGEQAAATRRFSGGVAARPLAEVRQALVDRVGPERAQDIFGRAEQVWGFTRSMRQRMHQAGTISDQVYRAWERDFPHYVRADILDYLPDAEGRRPPSTGRPILTVSDLGIRRLTTEGTTRARDLPLNSVVRQAFATETLTRRNQGAQSILALRDASPELQRLLREVPDDYRLKGDEAAFSVYVNGEQHRFVGPKSVVEGLTRFEGEQAGGILDAAAKITGAPLLRAGATGYNVLFLPLNALRDAYQFMIRTGGLSDLRKTGHSAGELGRAYWDSFTRGDSDPDLAEALRAGMGQTHEFFNLSPTQIRQRLLREGSLGGRVRPVTNATELAGAVKDVLGLPFDPIRATGEKIERAPRLAAYRMARAAGKTPEEAALAGRDITMDFARGGTFAKMINRFVPFFNVAVQSPERFLTQDLAKGRKAQTAIGLVAGVLAPAAAAEAWNRATYPEDYAQVPDYLKDSGIVVMLPIEPQDNPDGTPGQRPYLWLPMPQQYAFLKVVQDQALGAAYGDDSRAWGDALAAALGSAVKLPGTETGMPLPPTARLAADLATNYDPFRDRPIVPEKYQNLPPESQATPQTSALGRAIGGVAGQYNVPVVGQMGPAKVDYAVQALTGGVGKQVLGASDVVARAFGLPAAEPGPVGALDVPVVGGLAGTVVRTRGGQVERDAYALLEEHQQRDAREALARLRESSGWQRATSAQRGDLEARIASRVAQQYAARRKAVTAGQGAYVIERERGR